MKHIGAVLCGWVIVYGGFSFVGWDLMWPCRVPMWCDVDRAALLIMVLFVPFAVWLFAALSGFPTPRMPPAPPSFDQWVKNREDKI